MAHCKVLAGSGMGGRMSDLTILFITASEMPTRWSEFQLFTLIEASMGYPIVSVSRKPLELGTNLIDNEPKSYWNIYMQMLRAARMATTPFVAMAEDDTLYTKEHFKEFRPPTDSVSYDRSRWSLFSWDPLFCLRQRISNCSLIAPRELLIEALSERAQRWPHGGPEKWVGEVGRKNIELGLQVTSRNSVDWFCSNPIVQLNHPCGTDDRQKTRWKKHGQIKAIEIPHWGKATDIVRIYEDA